MIDKIEEGIKESLNISQDDIQVDDFSPAEEESQNNNSELVQENSHIYFDSMQEQKRSIPSFESPDLFVQDSPEEDEILINIDYIHQEDNHNNYSCSTKEKNQINSSESLEEEKQNNISEKHKEETQNNSELIKEEKQNNISEKYKEETQNNSELAKKKNINSNSQLAKDENQIKNQIKNQIYNNMELIKEKNQNINSELDGESNFQQILQNTSINNGFQFNPGERNLDNFRLIRSISPKFDKKLPQGMDTFTYCPSPQEMNINGFDNPQEINKKGFQLDSEIGINDYNSLNLERKINNNYTLNQTEKGPNYYKNYFNCKIQKKEVHLSNKFYTKKRGRIKKGSTKIGGHTKFFKDNLIKFYGTKFASSIYNLAKTFLGKNLKKTNFYSQFGSSIVDNERFIKIKVYQYLSLVVSQKKKDWNYNIINEKIETDKTFKALMSSTIGEIYEKYRKNEKYIIKDGIKYDLPGFETKNDRIIEIKEYLEKANKVSPDEIKKQFEKAKNFNLIDYIRTEGKRIKRKEESTKKLDYKINPKLE